jgi:hypothetical protein
MSATEAQKINTSTSSTTKQETTELLQGIQSSRRIWIMDLRPEEEEEEDDVAISQSS